MNPHAVLVADDDPQFRELIQLVIEMWGLQVFEAASFGQATEVARAQRERIGIVLLDYFMPGDRDIAVCTLLELFGEERIILCTAAGDASWRAKELRLSLTLPKPVDMRALEHTVCRLCTTSAAP
jgi:DNA-binding response OmpR family regulator